LFLKETLLIKRGLLLEYLTLGWNVVGVVIVIFAAFAARSVALAGFGLDSLIEIFASVVVAWQLTGVHQQRERLALRLSLSPSPNSRLRCNSSGLGTSPRARRSNGRASQSFSTARCAAHL
jgi:hypothetical protein